MIQFPAPAAWEYFRARHLSTALTGATCVKPGDSGQSARARLVRGSFDQAPVLSNSGRVAGWVATRQLQDQTTVRRVMTSVADAAIVSSESPIGNVIELLGQQDLVFTIGDNGISGFIVHSDLDRQQARTYFYLVVAGIEMLLSDIIRSVYPESAVVDAMSPGQKKQYHKAKEANNDTHPVEYLYLRTLVELFVNVPSVKDGHTLNEGFILIDWLRGLNKFRTLVMHPVCSIATSRSSLEIAEFTRMAHEVIQRLQVMSQGLRGFSGVSSLLHPEHLR